MKNRRSVLFLISLLAANLTLSPLAIAESSSGGTRLSSAHPTAASAHPTVSAAKADAAASYLQASAEDVARWRQWKFGLLISWAR